MTEFYYYFWLLYGLGVAGFLYLCWRLCNKISITAIRTGLFLLIAVFLVTPWTAVPGRAELAPAFVIIVVEALLGDGNIWRGLLPITAVYCLLLVALFGNHWLQRRFSLLNTGPGKAASGVIEVGDRVPPTRAKANKAVPEASQKTDGGSTAKPGAKE